MHNLSLLRVYAQAHAVLVQKVYVDALLKDMEEVWEELKTPEKRCIITTEVATTSKRQLVKRYISTLIRKGRDIKGLDLAPKIIDPDRAFWAADGIARAIADTKVEDHFSLFRSVVNACLGLPISVIDFMYKEDRQRDDLYTLLGEFYELEVIDRSVDEDLTLEWFTERYEAYLKTGEEDLFTLYAF